MTDEQIINSIWEDRYDDNDAFIDLMHDGFTAKEVRRVLGFDVAGDYKRYLKAMGVL